MWSRAEPLNLISIINYIFLPVSWLTSKNIFKKLSKKNKQNKGKYFLHETQEWGFKGINVEKKKS